MERHSLALPPDLEAALSRATARAPAQALRRLAAWATTQVPLEGPWAELAELAVAAADGQATPDGLAEAHVRRSGAACAATVSGLGRGIPSAAAHLTAYGAVHPFPAEAAIRSVASAYRWHVLSPGADAAGFARAARGMVHHLVGPG